MGSSYEIGQAYIGIVPKADGIQGKIQNAISGEATEAGKVAGKNVAGGLSSTLQSAGKTMIKAGALAGLISVPIIKGIKSALSAYEQQLTAETKLTEIYKTRLGVSEKVAKTTMNLAKEIQSYGVISDEVTLAGAQQVATFVKNADSVNNILPAMTDLIVQQKGYNATQQDAVNVANLVGKVMNGQVGALRRVGISFDKNQEYVLKYGTEEEKVAMLSEVITQNVGHMNKALADTPLGKIQQMKNSLGDLKESVGAQLAPVIATVAEWISAKLVPAIEKFIKFMGKHPIISKMVVAIAGILAVASPILIFFGTLAMSVGALIPVFSAVSAPMLAVAGIIIGVGTALVYAYTHSEKFRTIVNKLASFLFTVFKNAFENAKTKIKSFIDFVKLLITWTGNLIRALKDFGGYVKTAFVDKFTNARDIIKSAIADIKALFPLNVGKILANIRTPHFKVKGGKAPWGFGGLGEMPKISVDWYAQGFMTKGTSLIGVGEKGQEALVPLDPFWKKLDKMTSQEGVTINVYASEGMDVEELASAVEYKLIQAQKRRAYAWQ